MHIIGGIKHFYLVLLIFVLSTWQVGGSAGDVHPYFHSCVTSCVQTSPTQVFPPSPACQMVSWTTEEYCEYSCMTEMSDFRRQQGLSQWKFYGHWVFIRYCGFEEIASVVFSLGNAIPHVLWLTSWRKSHSNYTLLHWIDLYAIVAVNAWLASAVFHSQKHGLPSLYDYTSALLLVGYGAVIAMRKLVDGYKQQDTLMFVLCTIATGLYLIRVWHMWARPFSVSFDLHMKTCFVLVGIATTTWFIWIAHGLLSKQAGANSKEKYWYCLLVQLWFLCAALLEIFDFPPYFGLFDAHSLWHLATIPLGFVLYRFWHVDYQSESVNRLKQE